MGGAATADISAPTDEKLLGTTADAPLPSEEAQQTAPTETPPITSSSSSSSCGISADPHGSKTSVAPATSSDVTGDNKSMSSCEAKVSGPSAAALIRKRKKQQASLSVYLMNRRLNDRARTYSSSLTQQGQGLRLLSRLHKLDAGFFRRYMTYFAADFKRNLGDSALSMAEMRLATSAHFASLQVEPLDLLAAFMRTTTSPSSGGGHSAGTEALEALCSPPQPLPPPPPAAHSSHSSRQSGLQIGV